MQLFATDPAAQNRPRRVRIQGLEQLEAALARGKGVILWENPFGSALVGKLALIQRGFSIVQVHGPEHGGSESWLGQKVIRRLHRRISARLFEEIIDIDYRSLAYLRRIEERLKANRIVCLRAFGRAGKKFVLTRFNGQTLYFPTGMMTLARQADAVLMGMFCFADGQGDQLVLSAPLPVHTLERGDEGLLRLASHYLAELRCFVERYPKQWWGVSQRPMRKDRLKILQAEPEAELRPAAASEAVPQLPGAPAAATPRVAWWRQRRPCFLTIDAETEVIPEGVRMLSAIRDEVQHEVGMPIPITWFIRFQRRWGDYQHPVLPPVDSPRAFFDGFELLRPLVSELLSRGDEIGWHYHAYHYVQHRDLPHSTRIAVLESDLACCAGAMRSRHPELRIEAFRFGWFFVPDHSLYRTLAGLGVAVDASARPDRDGTEVQDFGIPHTPAIVREPALVHGILCVPYRSTWLWHDWELVPHEFSWHRMSPQEASTEQAEFRRLLRRIAGSARAEGRELATYATFRRSQVWNPR